ncbi:damage-control phosphatase ARMT1 family protein [Streptomyces sp. NPDC059096]|uniref:damage-control phosphatase ARMT1 family protein n=1 Tax=Streptomyces sp. NPDC059096 TaxID=3346727 RepID=UPI0036BE0C85
MPAVPPAADDAPVILGNEPGSFPRNVLATRHPALIRQVRDAFPYGPEQHEALDALLREITDGVMEPLPADAHDLGRWRSWGYDEQVGRSWFDAPFLWSESYFYRRLLGAVGYFTPGPWQGVDPFAPFKRAELRTGAVDDELTALDGLATVDGPTAAGDGTGRYDEDQAYALLLASLWGNRADLGFRISSPPPSPSPSASVSASPSSPLSASDDGGTSGTDSADSPLVADDSALLWSLLPGGAPARPVHLIADNAGRELIPDLVLLDHLLRTGRADRAVLHVKPCPYYVSDATLPDVVDALRRLRGAPGYAAEIGSRLWDAMATGRLDVRAHDFFRAPLPFDAMPADLRAQLAEASVTLVKGDLNYRRLVGDRAWPATRPFAECTAYFPGPVTALRTLKSDVIVGLSEATLKSLETRTEEAGSWRTSGTHALIQTRLSDR